MSQQTPIVTIFISSTGNISHNNPRAREKYAKQYCNCHYRIAIIIIIIIVIIIIFIFIFIVAKMDTIDKWLKSLRLHKYTHLFKSLTYEQMLNLEEKYLIDLDITKGARNKILVSVKKLNLRHERLINMIDDLNQDNISMKEALTVLKDILITPIPPPASESNSTTKTNNYSDPNDLTYLFVDTFEKVAHRLIESVGMEDNACHGIMAAIVDECLKHNSFTKEQKAKVASFKQNCTKEQKARMASFKQQSRHQLQQQQQLLLQHQRVAYGYNQHHYNSSYQQQHQHHYNNHQSHQFHHSQNYHTHNTNHHYHYHNSSINNNIVNHHYYHQHNNHWNGPVHRKPSPPSLSASLSTIGSASASTSDEEEQRQQTYKEYSLLGPGMTFELPCLRAIATSEKHNRRQLSFFSSFQSKSSC